MIWKLGRFGSPGWPAGTVCCDADEVGKSGTRLGVVGGNGGDP